MGIQQRFNRLKQEVSDVARLCNRDPDSIRIIAVSKTVDVSSVVEAISAGARDFAENRPDQLLEKATALPDQTWHFIGNIQSRRIRDIAAHASLVHSLYKTSHVPAFEAAAAQAGRVLEVLLEVNVSGEASKSGVSPLDAPALLQEVVQCPHLRARGLMTMAPQGDSNAARKCFEGLAELLEMLRGQISAPDAENFNELSMGMSQDWKEAIAAGATMIRIGRAIFSDSLKGFNAEK